MDLKKLLVICATLICFGASNLLAQNVCQLTPGPYEKKIRINELPGFFFKVHPSGNYLTFIGEDLNKLLDLNTGESYKTNEMGDPVWSPDGKFLVTLGLRFYNGDEYISASKKGKPEEAVPKNVDIAGTYQSIAKTDGGYKVITDLDGISIAKVNTEGTLSSEIKKPCANVPNFPTDLPMISKDGNFLSVMDSSTNSTKIFNIENDECELSLDLGFPTGKVSFNSDSTQIAFHIDQFSSTPEEGYFSGVDGDKVKNVIVMNLEPSKNNKKLVPSSWALASHHIKLGDGGYYPDFDASNNLYYLEDVENNYAFVKINPKNLEFRPFSEGSIINSDCVNCEDSTKASSIVAKIWTDVCKKTLVAPMTQEKSLVRAIDPAACLKLIEDNWVESLGRSKEELKEICPKKEPVQGSTVGVWDGTRKKTAQNIISSRCIICHSRPIEYEVDREFSIYTGPKELEKKTIKIKGTLPALKKDESDLYVIAKMKIALENGVMPKGDSLSPDDHKSLIMYLYQKLMDVPRDALRYSSGAYSTYRYNEASLEEERRMALDALPSDASDDKKREVVLGVNCQLGQKDCATYIEIEKDKFRQEALKLPFEKRSKYVEKKVMSIKCDALFETTFDQCLKWKIEN